MHSLYFAVAKGNIHSIKSEDCNLVPSEILRFFHLPLLSKKCVGDEIRMLC